MNVGEPGKPRQSEPRDSQGYEERTTFLFVSVFVQAAEERPRRSALGSRSRKGARRRRRPRLERQ